MAEKLIVFVAALAMVNAVPIWVIAPRSDPNIGQAPSLAYGFGSGFSSDVAGVKHSTSIGSSFSTGDAQAYGQGISSAGDSYARGVGAANNAPTYQYQYQPNYRQAPQYYNPGSLSSAQAYNTPQFAPNTQSVPQYQPQYHGYRSAVTNAVDNGQYKTTLSSAQNVEGQNFETAVSAIQQGENFNSAISNAQSLDAGGLRSATAASEDVNGYKASTAQAVHQAGGALYNSGATTINGPGIQAAQSHAISYF